MSNKIEPIKVKLKTEKRQCKEMIIDKDYVGFIDDMYFKNVEREIIIGIEEVPNAELVLKINEIINIINREVVD